jgi:phage terminase small subunit
VLLWTGSAPSNRMMLTSKQARFVEEYLVDCSGKQAAIRAGYSPKSAEAQASRLLSNARVQAALQAAMRARSRRTEVTADRVVTELAKLAFADMRDYWPQKGEQVDLTKLDPDRTAAIAEITIDEECEPPNGKGEPTRKRKTRLKLHDKKGALDSLARHLGMFVDRHVAEGSIEHQVLMMTPEERKLRARQLLESARRYLPPMGEETREERRKPKSRFRATVGRRDRDE